MLRSRQISCLSVVGEVERTTLVSERLADHHLSHGERLLLCRAEGQEVGKLTAGHQKAALAVRSKVDGEGSGHPTIARDDRQVMSDASYAGAILGRDGLAQQSDEPLSDRSAVMLLGHREQAPCS